jgi:hypothetical protein
LLVSVAAHFVVGVVIVAHARYTDFDTCGDVLWEEYFHCGDLGLLCFVACHFCTVMPCASMGRTGRPPDPTMHRLQRCSVRMLIHPHVKCISYSMTRCWSHLDTKFLWRTDEMSQKYTTRSHAACNTWLNACFRLGSRILFDLRTLSELRVVGTRGWNCTRGWDCAL